MGNLPNPRRSYEFLSSIVMRVRDDARRIGDERAADALQYVLDEAERIIIEAARERREVSFTL